MQYIYIQNICSTTTITPATDKQPAISSFTLTKKDDGKCRHNNSSNSSNSSNNNMDNNAPPKQQKTPIVVTI